MAAGVSRRGPGATVIPRTSIGGLEVRPTGTPHRQQLSGGADGLRRAGECPPADGGRPWGGSETAERHHQQHQREVSHARRPRWESHPPGRDPDPLRVRDPGTPQGRGPHLGKPPSSTLGAERRGATTRVRNTAPRRQDPMIRQSARPRVSDDRPRRLVEAAQVRLEAGRQQRILGVGAPRSSARHTGGGK